MRTVGTDLSLSAERYPRHTAVTFDDLVSYVVGKVSGSGTPLTTL